MSSTIFSPDVSWEEMVPGPLYQRRIGTMRALARLLGERYAGETNCELFNVEGFHDDLLSILDYAADEHLLPSRCSVSWSKKSLINY